MCLWRQSVVGDQEFLVFLSRFPLRAVGHGHDPDCEITEYSPHLRHVIQGQEELPLETGESLSEFNIVFFCKIEFVIGAIEIR